MPRPTLLPGLTRLWRDRHTLQLGARPAAGRPAGGGRPARRRGCSTCSTAPAANAPSWPRPATVDVTAGRRPHPARRAARRRPGGRPRTRLLPRDLTGPARPRLAGEAARAGPGRRRDYPAPRPRCSAGAAPPGSWSPAPAALGAPVAVALAQAGVGHVHPDLAGPVDPADLVGSGLPAADLRPAAAAGGAGPPSPASPRAPAPARAARRGSTWWSSSARTGPPALLAAGYAQRRQPHLLVTLRDGVPVIGPLVRPPGGALPALRRPAPRRPRPGLAGARRPARRRPTAPSRCDDRHPARRRRVRGGRGAGAPRRRHRRRRWAARWRSAAPGRLRRRAWPPHPGCACCDAGRRRRRAGRPVGAGAVGARSRARDDRSHGAAAARRVGNNDLVTDIPRRAVVPDRQARRSAARLRRPDRARHGQARHRARLRRHLRRDPAAHRRAAVQRAGPAQGRGDEVRPGAVGLRGGAARGDRRARTGRR